MANKKQVNLIQYEGTETSRVIYPVGILMVCEINYIHPQKWLMVIKSQEYFQEKSPYVHMETSVTKKTFSKAEHLKKIIIRTASSSQESY